MVGSVGWLAPPEHGLVLAYRSGEEEGSCQRDVIVDMVGGDVEVRRESDC